MRRVLGGRICWIVIGAAFLACSSEEGPSRSAVALCVDARTVALELEAVPQVVKLYGAATTVELTVLPLYETGATIPERGPEAYALDRDGDGVFETHFVGRTTAVTVTTPGRHPFQVTATRCDGKLVVGRTQVQAYRTQPPILELRFSPAGLYWVPAGTNVMVSVYAVDPDGGEAMDVAWSWGDGAGGERRGHRFDTEGNLLLQHVYARRGVFRFSLWVTDVAGDVAIQSVEILVSGVVRVLEGRNFGATLYAAAVQPVTGASGPATRAYASLGPAGLEVLEIRSGTVRRLGHYLPEPGRTPSLVDLALDPRHGVLYAATDKYGVYILDVTATATAVAPLFPYLYVPTRRSTQEGILNVDRVWVCEAGRWIWVRNTYDGLYLLRLTDPTLLETYRGNPPADPLAVPNPYAEALRTDGAEPAPLLDESTADDVACWGRRWVGVAAGGRLRIYDLAPYFASGVPPVLVRELVPPTVAPGIEGKALAVSVTAEAGGLVWEVALGEHGVAAWRMTTEPVSFAFSRHFYIYHDRLIGTQAYDYVADLVRRGDQLWFVDYAYGLQDAVLRMRPEVWDYAHGTTRYYPYGDDKCMPANIENIREGDPLTDVTGCWAGVSVLAHVGRAGSALWWLGFDGVGSYLIPIDGDTDRAGAKVTTPVYPELVVPLASGRYWRFTGAQVVVTAPTTTSTHWRPADLDAGTLPLAPKYRFPVRGVSEVVLADDASMAWLVPGDDDRPLVVATAPLAAGWEAVAVDALDRRYAVLRGGDRRLEFYRWLPPLAPTLEGTSLLGGYRSVRPCEGGFYALRAESPVVQVERFPSPDERFAWGTVTEPGLVAWSCDGGELVFVHDESEAMHLRVTGYPLGVSGGAPRWQLEIPYRGNDPPQEVELVREGRYLLLRLGGIGNGVFAFDVDDPEAPDFVAADLGVIASRLRSFAVAPWPGGGVWYGGIYDDPRLGAGVHFRSLQ